MSDRCKRGAELSATEIVTSRAHWRATAFATALGAALTVLSGGAAASAAPPTAASAADRTSIRPGFEFRTPDPAEISRLFVRLSHGGQPGCAVGVRHAGELLHTSAYGLADVTTNIPLSTDSVFNVASVSKQFTAFAVLLLAQRGSLALDDRVTKYLPELAPSAGEVTLRDLLHHVGGLRDYMALLELQGRRYTEGSTQAEAIALLARQKGVNASPGTAFEYSNTGYTLLAEVVQRVAGMPLASFMASNVFGPLGMRRTSIVDRYPAKIDKLARGHAPSGRSYRIEESGWEQLGDGQVYTTVEDLTRWSQNLRTGEVGGPDVIAALLEPGVLSSGESTRYAAGFYVREYRGRRVFRHSGEWIGYVAQMLWFPESQLAISVLCNRTDAKPWTLAETIADLYLPPIPGAPRAEPSDTASPAPKRGVPAKVTLAELQALEGSYLSDEANARCHVRLEGKQLVLDVCADALPLLPLGANRFASAAGQTSATFLAEDGVVSRLIYSAPGLRELRFERRADGARP
ncbi:MAG: serine hydrolase domain-containing protein [Gammaproteobacteria bacterium]